MTRIRNAPATLQGAREQVAREWPGREATPAAVRAYHERAAELFAHVAEVDTGHRHEALFWAAQEREYARVASDPAGLAPTVVVPEEVGDDGCG